MATGCEVLRSLWKAALECKIDKPGITGTLDRTTSFVQCRNIRDTMAMASLKCWEERTLASYPPMIIVDEHKSLVSVEDNSKSSDTSTKSKN
jgi:hypothetical protein